MSVRTVWFAHEKRLVVVCLVSSVASCYRHVHIPNAPTSATTRSEQVAYYEQFRTESAEQVTRTMPLPNGQSQSRQEFAYIRLQNGMCVEDPEDLRPAVAPHSVTSHALDNIRTLSVVNTIVTASGGTMAAIGAGLLINAFTSASREATSAIIGASLLVAATFTAIFERTTIRSRISSEREYALLTYNDSLRERVGLCGDGTTLGDCANASTVPDAGIHSVDASPSTDASTSPNTILVPISVD